MWLFFNKIFISIILSQKWTFWIWMTIKVKLNFPHQIFQLNSTCNWIYKISDLYVKHVSSSKNGLKLDGILDRFLYGSCKINYKDEEIELHFNNHNFHWNLKKISVIYKKLKIEEKNFEGEGFPSHGHFYQHKISFGINIKDLNIQYSDCNEKSINFLLEYTDDEGNLYNSQFLIEFPVVKHQNPWRFSFLGFYHPRETICKVFNKNFALDVCESGKEKTMCEELEWVFNLQFIG